VLTRLAVPLTFTLLVLISLAGCGATPLPGVPALPSAADAQKAVCGSLVGITSGVDRLASIDASTTVADLKSIKAPVDTAVAAIKAANQVLNQPNIAEMTTAYDNLTATISRLPDNAAVGETAVRIRSGAVAVRDALIQARVALACP
jgi:hypothetical protein